MAEQRQITTEYLNLFVTTIAKGAPVVYVQGSGLLAVDHPSQGYLILSIADKVLDSVEESSITNDPCQN